MQSDIINIQLTQLVFAYIFVLILLYIVKQKEIGHKGEVLLASVRMTIQLVAVGFILEYVFA
ncbi:MAG: ABC transporter permease, partial [Halanaerobium sp.]